MRGVIPPSIRPAFPETVPAEAVRGKLLELLGIDEVPESVDFSLGPVEEADDGISARPVAFLNDLGEEVPGILCVPPGAKRRAIPGVLCLSIKGGRQWDAEHWNREGKLLAPYGRCQMGVAVGEALRAARVLQATEPVDPERIGVTGFSLGGNVTWYSMACAPWIHTAAPLCGGLGTMASVIHEAEEDRHSAYFFIPHMLRYFDHPLVVSSCVAPRPLLMLSPTQDEDMPSSGVDELIRVVAPLYVAAGGPECFEVYRPESNHVFRVEFFEWMARGFARHLAPRSAPFALGSAGDV